LYSTLNSTNKLPSPKAAFHKEFGLSKFEVNIGANIA
jgi:hypothetical protein